MTTKSNQHEDMEGAIETVERRVAYLSNKIVHPPEGTTPVRSAHWRDEVELRALRLAGKALREKRDRQTDEAKLVALLGDLAAFLDDSSDPRAAVLLDRIDERLESDR